MTEIIHDFFSVQKYTIIVFTFCINQYHTEQHVNFRFLSSHFSLIRNSFYRLNMTYRINKQTQNPYETLERLLNKTTLSTQRVAHSNIVGKLMNWRFINSYVALNVILCLLGQTEIFEKMSG